MARTERYLASGSRIVVSGKGRPAQWFNTTKDVVVTDDVAAVCPITNQPVRQITQSGFTLFTPANLIRTRCVFEEGDINIGELANLNPVLFVYDIPDDSEFPNPSGQLRRFAVRLNLSGWIMRQSDVPHALIGRMLDAGCDPHVVKIAPDEAQKMVGIAVSRMQREIRDKIRNAEKSQRDAEAKLAAATETTGQTPEQAQTAYLRTAAAIAKRLQELTADLDKAAACFGINPRVLETNRLGFTANAIQSAMAERAKAYLAAARAARETGTAAGQQIANAIESDAMDPMVAADFLDENGADGSALRAAFGPGAETPESDEPETFRLPGADEPDEPETPAA